ncbi:MAG: ribosome small subunit-dependent GTPase A [Oscillospiraceae bacterium]
MEIKSGIIINSVSGFYDVLCETEVYQCKAKGVFRNNKLKPLTGDYVDIELTNESNVICKIKDRKNSFSRPPIANLDKLFIVISTVDPLPNFLVIDKMLAISILKNVEPVIIITKTDKQDAFTLEDIYKKSGIKIIKIDYNDNLYIEEIDNLLKNKIVSFVGNSGVGKSTLLNELNANLNLKTDNTSKKLGRGKHTTRTVTLYRYKNIALLADTPGFSSLDIDKNNLISKEDLQFAFKEFEDYIGFCKYRDCSHTVEKGCKILDKVNDGEISKIRHENYVNIYRDCEKIKHWELGK